MKKILIADDERSIRILLRGTMEVLDDVELIEASDGIEALEKVMESKPDLAVLDVMMPGMTGLEACRAIKSNESLKDTRVIILTAKVQKSDMDDAANAGADRYIFKPFSPSELLDVVEEILNE
ncbi:response regulator transcription factor [Calorimonas adulescens]|jgi:Response regulator receiver domain.|uniref:Stage 0 sporulation protein A homolog n=1 Tax=Calorimonas adulescens TaxID=2606906 RepID=A0A5D8QD42_9THEO|nr:response regulator [Calorimonas adulescens]TZE82451.1 response regulator [Calorimonas adulescens]